MTERLPRADAVLQPGRDVVCRPCDQEIVGQEAFVGVTEADPAHVCWECPDCGLPMKLKEGRYGFFWGCEGYPQCQKTFQVEDLTDEEGE